MSFDSFDDNSDYGDMVQAKLEDVLKTCPPQPVARVIRRVVENLVVTERIAGEKGIEIGETDKRRMMEKHYPDIQAEVDRALGEMIGSILSREGG